VTITAPDPQPTRVQLVLLAAVPTTGGVTTEEVWAAAKDAGLATSINARGEHTVCGYPLRSTLRFMRRAGWLIFNRHADPPEWSRTPTGTDTIRRTTTRMSTTPRQEATR
jgi:hypothetical protein